MQKTWTLSRNEGIDGGHESIVIDIQSREYICRVTGLTERFGNDCEFVSFSIRPTIICLLM